METQRELGEIYRQYFMQILLKSHRVLRSNAKHHVLIIRIMLIYENRAKRHLYSTIYSEMLMETERELEEMYRLYIMQIRLKSHRVLRSNAKQHVPSLIALPSLHIWLENRNFEFIPFCSLSFMVYSIVAIMVF